MDFLSRKTVKNYRWSLEELEFCKLYLENKSLMGADDTPEQAIVELLNLLKRKFKFDDIPTSAQNLINQYRKRSRAWFPIQISIKKCFEEDKVIQWSQSVKGNNIPTELFEKNKQTQTSNSKMQEAGCSFYYGCSSAHHGGVSEKIRELTAELDKRMLNSNLMKAPNYEPMIYIRKKINGENVCWVGIKDERKDEEYGT